MPFCCQLHVASSSQRQSIVDYRSNAASVDANPSAKAMIEASGISSLGLSKHLMCRCS
jgi:hypothetical protein